MASAWNPIYPYPPKVYLLFGGNSSDWTVDRPVTDADVTFTAEDDGDYMGHGLDGVGDVNNDGYDDFVITSEFNSQSYSAAGKAYLILGRETNAWNTTVDISEAASASFLGSEAGGWLGMNAAGVGDVNNDGFDDFLLGGATQSTFKIRENYLIFGRPTQRWHKDVPKNEAINLTFRFKTEDQLLGAAGRFMSGLGDVNNDSLDDFIVGAYGDDEGGINSGQSFLYLGRSSNHWPSSHLLVNASDYANASFLGESANDCSGYSVSGVGDINVDGYDDILIGASYGQVTNEGKAYVIFGRAANHWVMDQSLSLANLTILGGEFTGTNSRFATDVSGVGDINDDGYADFSISAPWVNNRNGMIFVILGNSSWVSTIAPDTTTTSTTSPTDAPSWTSLIVLICLTALVGKKRKF